MPFLEFVSVDKSKNKVYEIIDSLNAISTLQKIPFSNIR